jgi:hypothetical protein
MSTGSIAKLLPPKVKATVELRVQGTVKPFCASPPAPGIAAWIAAASFPGMMIKVVPVSITEDSSLEDHLSILKRAGLPRIASVVATVTALPSTVTLSTAACQNPFWSVF